MNTTQIFKNKTKWLMVFFTASLVVGCTDGKITLTAEAIAEVNAVTAKKGKARKELFIECMELSAKMERQGDDDVSDIVEECTTSSYYMTNYIK